VRLRQTPQRNHDPVPCLKLSDTAVCKAKSYLHSVVSPLYICPVSVPSSLPGPSQSWEVNMSSPQSPKDLICQALPAPQTPVGWSCSENTADIS